MLQRYSLAQLIASRRPDPGLTGRNFANAETVLDQMDDQAFIENGLSQRDVTGLRGQLAS
jgi:hypothetical protein